MALTLVNVPALIIVGLLVLVSWMSVLGGGRPAGELTAENYRAVTESDLALTAVGNTVKFTLVTMVVAVVIGIAMAWLVEKTNFGHRKGVYTFMTVKLLVPGFVTAMGWIFMFHPRMGTINQLLRGVYDSDSGPVNIVSITGMGIVQGIGLASLVFIMTASGFRELDSSLEEAARMSGAGPWHTLFRVTLPLVWPQILAATIYTVAVAIAVFDVPLIIGFANRIYTFSTFLYVLTNPTDGLPEWGIAAAASMFMLVLAFGIAIVYTRVLKKARNYQVVTGKGYLPRKAVLGRWRPVAWLFVLGYATVALVLPLLLLLWVSVQPYMRPFSLSAVGESTLYAYRSLPWGAMQEAFVNSGLLTALVPTLAIVMSLLFSWTVLRSNSRWRFGYDFVAFLPQAVPNVVFALGALIFALYWTSGWYDMYRSLSLIVIVMALLHVSFGTRMLNGALLQIHPEMEEAGRMSGAPLSSVVRWITVPLIKPTIVLAWLWLAMLTFRDLTIPVFLGSDRSITIPLLAWQAWSAGETARGAAISLLMVVAVVPLAVLYLTLARVGKDGTKV